jgi:tRNA-2-methylthio-N6-dimethylallyladenosine synthase
MNNKPDERAAAKKLFIKTWGCQMNVYDSARMADAVAPLGYVLTDAVAEADLVIFNTCHIREKASEKLFSELGRLRPVKEERAANGRATLIAVAGCVAQAEGEDIHLRAPYVDLVFGPQAYHRLPEMIASLARREGRIINIEFPPEPKFDHLPLAQGRQGVSAFLTAQEGCDKFCTYCVVPYTRGAEYSRPPESVVAEAEDLVRRGAREITLLGQNINGWHDGTRRLGYLVRQLAGIPGLVRLRYTTSHPLDMDDDLIAAHRDVPQLMPFLHLPAQSGSDAVLKAMNRGHTTDDYRRVIDKLRAARPDIALSSDFIVGFPGETDADFQATMRLVRDVVFAQAYSFKYSRRPGTPGAAMADQVELAAKNARLQELQALLNDQQERFNVSFIGKTLPVLFEEASKRSHHLFGRTPYLQPVQVRGPEECIGKERPVSVIAAGKNTLQGELTA